jgi:PAS domain S-box-containing protein
MSAKPSYDELAEKIEVLEQDLSTLKRSDHELFIQAIADTTPSALYIYDFELRCNVWVNGTHREIIGPLMGKDPACARREDIFALLHPEDVDELTDCVERLKRQTVKRCEEVIYRMRSRDGQWRWFADRISVFKRHEDGRLLQILGAATDITRRKQAEMALRQIQEQLRATLEALPDILFEVDLTGRIHDYRAPKPELFSVAPCDMVGKTIGKILPKEAAETVYHAMQEAFEKGRHSGALVQINTLEGLNWFELSIAAKKDCKVDEGRLIVLARDITPRKKAQDALRQSEERFRTLFEEVPAAIQGYGPDGRIHYWNRASESIYGYTKEEAIGGNLIELIIPPDMRELVAAAVAHGAQTGEMPPPEELWLMHKDHSLIPLLSSHVVIRHPDKPAELYCLDMDLRELKRLQAHLQQRHKMEAIGTLTAGVAHDFNNILGIIIGNTELALDDIPSFSPTRFSLEEIKTAGLRAKEIVQQLLAFSRKADRKRVPIRLMPVVRDALKFLRATIPATIEIKLDFRATEDNILSDPTLIHQIMMNLCSNATHAMEEAGGLLTIGLENVILDRTQAKAHEELSEGQYIKLTVGDNGTGIDPKDVDRIFDPYFTTKAVGKGSGMGLTVVHGIVRDHNGTILVDNRPGKGAKFSILLPVSKDSPVNETQLEKRMPGGRETILFIDDEMAIVNMTRQVLERLGYRVETAVTPRAALESFRNQPDHFDLVITDMTMPQMTGATLLRHLREICKDIPVIINTGYSARLNEQAAKELGADALILKPLDRHKLAETIRAVLDKHGKG